MNKNHSEFEELWNFPDPKIEFQGSTFSNRKTLIFQNKF